MSAIRDLEEAVIAMQREYDEAAQRHAVKAAELLDKVHALREQLEEANVE